MRASQTGPATGLIAQVLLLAVLAGTAGLGAAGWVVGVACAVTMAAALARGLARGLGDRLEPASWVTLARATLAVGVAALAADSFTRDTPVALLVTLAAVALALDAVDGWVARRTGTASALGARFDGEVDAFLILALSVYVAPASGAWVLAIGAARYLFLAGEWLLPWMRAPLPPRRWRKLVAAAQGIVLTVAAAEVLPRALTQALLVAALAALAASVGECTWWLWRRRDAARDQVPEGDVGQPERGPLRTGIAVALTVLALLLVWAALVAPHQPSRLSLGAFARLPLELLVIVALAVLLPATPRRVLAVVVGAVLGVLVLVKVLDMGFYMVFDRPFNPFDDWSHRGTAIETLRDAFGRSHANLAVAVAVVLVVALFVVLVAALLRVTRVAAGHRGRALPAVAALGVVWVVLRVLGAPVASTSAVALAVHEVQAVRTGLQDRATLAARDRPRPLPRHSRRPAADRPARQGRPPCVRRELREGRGPGLVLLAPRSTPCSTRAPRSCGPPASPRAAPSSPPRPSAASAGWRTPPCSRGSWIDSQRRYNQLVQSDRLTLSQAFKRAGWRAVGDVPANNRAWPEGSTFYHFDKVYDSRNVGYRGPRFGYPTMPDQYVLQALHRLELARRHRPALFAEVDLVSSHAAVDAHPPAHRLGRRRRRLDLPPRPGAEVDAGRALQRPRRGPRRLRSFDRVHAERDLLVRAALRRRQPRARRRWATISPRRSSPARAPATTCRSRSSPTTRRCWTGSPDGAGRTACRPSPQAPVWRMNAFRDRFLTAFGSSPASG